MCLFRLFVVFVFVRVCLLLLFCVFFCFFASFFQAQSESAAHKSAEHVFVNGDYNIEPTN